MNGVETVDLRQKENQLVGVSSPDYFYLECEVSKDVKESENRFLEYLGFGQEW